MGDLEVGELPPATRGSFDVAAFGELYSRHERSIASFLMRRTGSAELAADLTAEVFAAALLAWRRQGRPADERAWLFGIANTSSSTAIGTAVSRTTLAFGSGCGGPWSATSR